MLPSLILLGFIFIIGLVIGSFLNVVILRTVSEESIVFPGSKCPKCQNPLKWYHNIPLLSYLFLGGKCAYCKERISWQYPFVEFLTGCIFVLLFIKFIAPIDPIFGFDALNPVTLEQIVCYIFSLIASCMFIVLSGTDFLSMTCMNSHLYSLIISGLILGIILTIINPVPFLSSPIFYSILLGLAGFLVMEIYRLVASFFAGQMAHGDGDAYILAGIGTNIGALLGVCDDMTILTTLKYMGFILLSSIILVPILNFSVFVKEFIKDKTTFTILSTLIIFTACTRVINEFFETGILYIIISFALLVILSILFIKNVFHKIRTKESDGSPKPYGPPLLIAGLIAILFLPI